MRGQVVIEFLIITGIAMIVGMLYLALSANLMMTKSEEQRIAALNDIGYMIQDEIILATTVQDGYSRTFTIPEKASRFTYEVALTSPTTVTLQSGSVTANYRIPEVDAGSTLAKGENTITKRGAVEVN